MTNQKTEQRGFRKIQLRHVTERSSESELCEVLMNGPMISYEGRCGPLSVKNVVTFVGMSTRREYFCVPEKKLLDGCNPGSTALTPPQLSQTSVVGIVCLVVHDEFVVHKVETV